MKIIVCSDNFSVFSSGTYQICHKLNLNERRHLKVRFLEAQNRKLVADLDLLRGKWGKDTFNIKQMYEGELSVSVFHHTFIKFLSFIYSSLKFDII